MPSFNGVAIDKTNRKLAKPPQKPYELLAAHDRYSGVLRGLSDISDSPSVVARRMYVPRRICVTIHRAYYRRQSLRRRNARPPPAAPEWEKCQITKSRISDFARQPTCLTCPEIFPVVFDFTAAKLTILILVCISPVKTERLENNWKMIETIEHKIELLKKKRNAVILAHNYQLGEVQDIADFVGDSLELAQRAVSTNADVIVFCGVLFMAETAAMLSPEKTVLLPDANAGCPMADMITAQQLRQFKQIHPNAAVVCYVNSSAEVKAESDYCCTSSNAVEVVAGIDEDKEIIFVPDMNLGQHAAQQANRKLILWEGYCHVHVCIRDTDIIRAKQLCPRAVVMVHCECSNTVRRLADAVLSTSGMLKLAAESEADEFIVGTEIDMLHRLKKENPEKKFYPASKSAVCPNMKLTIIEKVLWALEGMEHRITVPEEISLRATKALDAMRA